MNILRRFFFHTAALLVLGLASQASGQSLPVEGRDYQRIEKPTRFAPVEGKIEVAEVFGYWCGHCANFRPLSEAWQRRLPAHVNYVHVPAVFRPNDAFARGYFAARELRLPASTHAALFRAIHETRTLPPNATAKEIAGFYARQGADPARFLARMDTPSVMAQLQRARSFIDAAGVEGTPTLIVDGRYRITGRSHEDNIRIADQLIAQLHAARRPSN